jgi:L-ascorbate metabolism protein UlaG (beta-lactamase superfamily)
MELTWQARFCVRIRSREATVVTDPFPADVGPTGRGLTGDIVTYSHAETTPPSAVRQMRKVVAPSGEEILVPASLERAYVLDGPGEFEVKQVLITGVRTARGATEGPNVAFVYELDGIHVCHLGDIGGTLSQDQLGELGTVEVLLVPVGGQLSATTAGEVVAQVDPKFVVPLAVTGDDAATQPIDRFVHEMGASNLVPQPRLTVTISSVPDETTVVLLEPRGKT